MSKLTVVTFEPDTLGFYVDGKLDNTGESYMEGRILREYIESDTKFDETSTRHYNWERPWEGVPDTLDECDEIYGD